VPLSLLRTVLRLDPHVPAGVVQLGPALRDDLTLHVSGVRIGDHQLDVAVERGRITARTDAPWELTIRS
jgi:hypothetical protein